MKKHLSLLLLSASIIFTSATTSPIEQTESLPLQTNLGQGDVYICNGKYATKFHKTKKCWGLSKCKGTITSHSVSDAKRKGFSACGICYK